MHVDQRPAARVRRRQRRAWPRCFEIIEDRGRLVEHEPVLLERRHAAIGVERQIRLFAVPPRRHVDHDELVRDLLLGKRNADPARIGRERVVVELDRHGGVSSKTRTRFSRKRRRKSAEDLQPAKTRRASSGTISASAGIASRAAAAFP
jgi:hypothetical protein